MRSNKGITLISLILYVIVFSVVIGTVASISGYFVKNTDEIVILSSSSEQYNRLITYLSSDINSINFKNITVENKYIDIAFLDETHHVYIYKDNKIYYSIMKKDKSMEKTVVICENIESYSFIYQEDKLRLSINIDGTSYNINYSIKNK